MTATTRRSAFLDPPDHDFDSARVALLPVPHEATVSYGGGTRRGPEAILEASLQVELYDEQLGADRIRSLCSQTMPSSSGRVRRRT